MKVCFFCASSQTLDSKYYAEAEEFGRQIVENDWTLVTGGSNIGLMKTLAKTVKINTGKSVGVIPGFFDRRNLTCHDNTEIIFSKDLQDRKKIIFDISDAFVILPGGFGTLDELLEIITLKLIGQANKPIVIFNQDGYYTHLLKQFDVIYKENFAKNLDLKAYHISDTISDTFEYIKNYNFLIFNNSRH